jgi:pyruvate/2-oxoglutarate dehydrogenase complex dihydrolipoamide dehydrogenase (E3) component
VKVIVVGGGPAGMKAAVHARRLGAEVMLLERNRLGGVCYNEGPVPVRTLAERHAWSAMPVRGPSSDWSAPRPVSIYAPHSQTRGGP